MGEWGVGYTKCSPVRQANQFDAIKANEFRKDLAKVRSSDRNGLGEGWVWGSG